MLVGGGGGLSGETRTHEGAWDVARCSELVKRIARVSGLGLAILDLAVLKAPIHYQSLSYFRKTSTSPSDSVFRLIGI